MSIYSRPSTLSRDAASPAATSIPCGPRTVAVARALESARCDAAVADLMFLEAWEATPTGDVGAVLRVAQIRRANPGLADAVRGEMKAARRR